LMPIRGRIERRPKVTPVSVATVQALIEPEPNDPN